MRILTGLVAVLLFAAPAAAQWAPIAGSGCPGSPGAIKWAGTPKPGAQIDAKSACSTNAETPYLLVGLPALVPLATPPACLAGCQLAVLPVLVQAPPQGGSAPISFVIPNNPALVGFTLAFQGLCVDTLAACVTFTDGVSMTVQ